MTGRSKTVEQQELYMSARRAGVSQRCAAAQAGMSERTGRRVEGVGWCAAGQGPKRDYATRADPFADVWESEVVPLLASAPGLQAQTILYDLQQRHPGRFPLTQLRTLQRRVRRWRSLSGPDQAICFPQQALPGQQALCDFTDMNTLKICVAGVVFVHRLIHVRLRYSGMAYVEVVQGGESFTALASGVRHALEAFGGVPETLRTDSLSAAYKTGAREGDAAGAVRELTEGYADFCASYGIKPTRNNTGVSHENGGIESPHGHLKNAIDQALLLRGDRNFSDVGRYQGWLHELVAQENGRRHACIIKEQKTLRPLPKTAPACHSLRTARVSGNSTIDVARCTYTVPSRLKGFQLSMHVYDDHVEGYVGTDLVFQSARQRPTSKNTRAWCVNYRHVIGSLRTKPGAFRQLVYQDVLHPSEIFRSTWLALDAAIKPAEQAVKIYLEILALAAQEGETRVEAYLQGLQERQQLPCLNALRAELHQQDATRSTQALQATTVTIQTHALSDYDALISCSDASAQLVHT